MASRSDLTMRRESSDATSRPTGRRPEERETWTEFLRVTAESSDPARHPALAGRYNTIATHRPSASSSRPSLDRNHSSTSQNRKRELSSSATPGRRDAPYMPHSPSQSSSSSMPPPVPPRPGGSEENPIDLTSPPRVPSRSPTARRSSTSSSIRVPRWQPDDEVDNCTSCRNPFTWYFRKHHCRKCGKVVCANCSTHRITIPKQFIVNPPVDPQQRRTRPLSLGLYLDSSEQSASDLSGGETVRVCNPCVPDPNYDPPPQQPSYRNLDPRQNPDYLNYIASLRPRLDPPPGYEEAAGSSGFTRPAPVSFRELEQQRQQQRPHTRHRSFTHGTTSSSRGARPQGMPLPPSMEAHDEAGEEFVHGRSAPAGPHMPARFNPRRPDRAVREEDQCPVCGKEQRGSDDERSRHIERCIRRTERRYSRAAHGEEDGHGGDRTGEPARQSIDHSAGQPQSFSSRFLGELGAFLPGRGPAPGPSEPEPEAPPGPRTPLVDMLRYKAAARDVVNQEEKGGPPQECIICLEEFELGQDLGRLDCLCKFHARCLDDWWRRKGTNECPTHKSCWMSV